MEKADFYVGIGPKAEWIGSVSRCGEIWCLSTQILLQVNRIMYEEMVIEYIKYCEGVIGNHICKWPWNWPDSRMTEYSYLFIPEHEKVYMSILGGDLVDPVKILQGKSLMDANVMLGPPIFPLMIEQVSFEDIDKYGFKSSAII